MASGQLGPMQRILATICLGILLWSAFGQVQAAPCGNLMSDAAGYGPYDYRDPIARRDKLEIVERRHFTEAVAELRHGSTATAPGSDIDYTLRHFPNHYRALDSMMRLALREGKVKPTGSRYTMDCWFERAHRFAPDDGVVLMLEAIYRDKQGKLDTAIQTMKQALSLDPQNANIHYNLGLLYVKAKQYEKAREQAHTAYKEGFPLDGLRKLLVQAGEWKGE